MQVVNDVLVPVWPERVEDVWVVEIDVVAMHDLSGFVSGLQKRRYECTGGADARQRDECVVDPCVRADESGHRVSDEPAAV